MMWRLALSFLFVLTAVVDAAEVLVTIAPHKYFVEKIGGDTVTVNVVVPSGASSHTFEPTPKQALAAGRSEIWFRIGEPFEKTLLNALQSQKRTIEVVDFRDGVEMICHHGGCCCHGDGGDLHTWLSPRLAKQQAAVIAKTLSAHYPAHKELYATNLKAFQDELDALDREISEALKPRKSRVIMVSHPAYAYFARDYDLQQLPVEFEGRDPSPRQLTRLLDQAKKNEIQVIYTQPQHSDKGARLIAKELGATIIVLDPYAENYSENMRKMALKFAMQ